MKVNQTILARLIRPLSPIPTGIVPKLEPIEPFSAILFDVYGTLLVSEAGELGVGRELTSRIDDLGHLLRRYGIDRPPPILAEELHLAIEEAHNASRRIGIDCPEVDIIRIWQRVLGSDKLHWLRDFALEYELTVNPVYPMPGFRELLTACEASHITAGIISNAQFYTVLVLEWIIGGTLADWGFNRRLLFFSWLEQHAKPSSIMFERARAVLREMAIPAASVIYVGNDMRNDMLPAAAVGFRTALFAGDRRSLRQREADECCRELTPDLIVTDLRQLIAITDSA